VLFTVLAGQFWRNLLGWWGFGAIELAGLLCCVVGFAVLRPRWTWRGIPKSLVAFLLIATLSIAWSHYREASVLGVALQWVTTFGAVFLALTLSWAELLRSLATALRWALGLSLAFELWVSLHVGHAVLPLWVDYATDKVPKEFYWSRGLLLDGGPVEGIVASHNLLGFLALLAVIVFAAQLVSGSVWRWSVVGRAWSVVWLLVAGLTLALTRSATVTVACAVVFVVFLFAVWARYSGVWGRRVVYLTAVLFVAGSVAALASYSPQILGALGRGENLTGRTTIWQSVFELAVQRPGTGWGWVGYWPPWVSPFHDLFEHGGVVYLQAHNAWLDVWLQLGVVGVVAFAALTLSTLWRSWFLAINRPHRTDDSTPRVAHALVPLLLMTALLMQGMAESRLLIEYGWVLLAVLAVMTKRQGEIGRPHPSRTRPDATDALDTPDAPDAPATVTAPDASDAVTRS